ncbi:hypothetical protein Scep_010656 [Stephania cephalantha]|uniref:Uncharacterized protein n=1 Tax=Stephania cephalantha TaxID=152367 RepID=A0AAP0JWH4_9MAGN
MGGVKRICGSLQSSLSSSYRSLKTLLVWGMENLEEWVEDAATFPCLKKMLIRHCPNLRRAPHLFPSLKSLELNEVGGSGVISITDSLTSLTSLTIANCDDLTFLPERLLRQNSQLSVAHLRCCTKLQSFVPDQQGFEGVLLESSLRKLVINYCDALMYIPDVRGFTSLQNLRIEDCLELETIPNGFLRFLVALKKLRIINCPKLNNLGGGGGGEMAFPSLQLMNVSNVYSISLFGKRNTLNSLTRLNISKVQELKTIPMELLQSFKHLQHLQIDDCPSFEGFGLSTIKEMPNINPCFHSLYIGDCPAMSSVDLRGFASLTKIAIIRCQGLKTLHGLQFLTVLEKLVIGAFSDDLHCFPLPNLISSLDELHILGWHALQSLPHQLQLLTTLKILYIGLFDCLTVLPEWLGNLTSLETLYIAECENLTHLPSKEQMQRLTSLRKLHISNCPRLKERCDRSGRGGPEWPKISHIQFLRID